MITKDNISVNHQITTMQNQINKLKNEKKDSIVKNYEMKKKNFKNELVFHNIMFGLILLSGLFGGANKLSGANKGRSAFDTFSIVIGAIGLLANLFYKKDMNKINQDMQKELNEVV